MIYWVITPVVKEDKGNVLVELRLGWTADMSEEELADYAEDAPRGWDSVTTTLEDAEALRDSLTELIEKHRDCHAELRAESNRRMDELFASLENILKSAEPGKETR